MLNEETNREKMNIEAAIDYLEDYIATYRYKLSNEVQEIYNIAIEALRESEWNVICSDNEGILYCLPDEEEDIILSYNNYVWIDTLTSDIHGVFFDNYGGIEEGMAWKYAIPYKEK